MQQYQIHPQVNPWNPTVDSRVSQFFSQGLFDLDSIYPLEAWTAK
jgi:hypothetical protein